MQLKNQVHHPFKEYLYHPLDSHGGYHHWLLLSQCKTMPGLQYRLRYTKGVKNPVPINIDTNTDIILLVKLETHYNNVLLYLYFLTILVLPKEFMFL